MCDRDNCKRKRSEQQTAKKLYGTGNLYAQKKPSVSAEQIPCEDKLDKLLADTQKREATMNELILCFERQAKDIGSIKMELNKLQAKMANAEIPVVNAIHKDTQLENYLHLSDTEFLELYDSCCNQSLLIMKELIRRYQSEANEVELIMIERGKFKANINDAEARVMNGLNKVAQLENQLQNALNKVARLQNEKQKTEGDEKLLKAKLAYWETAYKHLTEELVHGMAMSAKTAVEKCKASPEFFEAMAKILEPCFKAGFTCAVDAIKEKVNPELDVSQFDKYDPTVKTSVDSMVSTLQGRITTSD